MKVTTVYAEQRSDAALAKAPSQQNPLLNRFRRLPEE